MVFKVTAVDEDAGKSGFIKYFLSTQPLGISTSNMRKSLEKSSAQITMSKSVTCDDPLEAFGIVQETGEIFAKHR